MRYFSLLALLLASMAAAYATSISLTGVGKGGGVTPPISPCGTGVINLSTGCTQPMLGGL